MTRFVRALLAGTTLGVALLAAALAPAGSVAAHPLGNFSVSHLNHLVVEHDRIVNDVVVDAAEIPTAQDRPTVDVDDDGTVSAAEAARHADRECAAFAASVEASLDDGPLSFLAEAATFRYTEGQAGLETSRLECRLSAAVPDGFGTVRTLTYSDGYRPGRVGWREITAVGSEVGIIDSPVPSSSFTDGLRSYPDDLLESPLDVRTVVLDLGPGGVIGGEGSSATAEVSITATDRPSAATQSRDDLVTPRPGPLGRFVDTVQARFDGMIGGDRLTLGVGLAAIGLTIVLGASHALLPGHGKTVMAAYIAGRQGSTRDAVLVGATVTATHTGGVLLLGLALSVSTALAGETVLAWLGVSSGLLIAALGVALVVNATRRRGTGWLAHGHHHGPGGHTHDDDDHPHDHHHHDHSHHHDHEHGDHHRPAPGRVGRAGLVGMGVAGGLVPSPSALIVLLSAIALGRTWFGIVLVVGYGVGMAVVLTVAGIALVALRDRTARWLDSTGSRLSGAVLRWSRVAPFLTALLVVVVGVGVAMRSVVTL